MTDQVRFDVLGPLRVRRGGEAIKIGGRVQLKFLAALLVAPNRAVSDDRLVEEVWAGDPPASAYHLLQVYASRLRALIETGTDTPRIQRDGAGYRLEVDPVSIDAAVFVAAVDCAGDLRGDDAVSAAGELEEALSLWRGRPFGDLADDMPMVQAEAAVLEERRASAQEEYVDVELSLGHHDDVIPILVGLVDENPFRERLWSQLMLALYRSGREAEALRAYGRLSRLLGDELGLEPSDDLRRLEERILLQDPALEVERTAPASNLPSQLTSFVGRARELEELATRLEEHRLVTLTGVGGIGKTRLAIEVAHQAASLFEDGVWWIDLSAVSEPAEVPGRVAAVVGVGSQPGTAVTESMIRAFSRRRLLLVIDNCEQVVDAVAGLVVDLLRGCPHLRVVATSRMSLDVAGEVLWAVPPLDQPGPEDRALPDDLLAADAIRLFVERASAAQRSFRLTGENSESIVSLCRRLDGLPLGIEMAAARVAVLAPAQIEARLSDRFTLLHGPRHPSIPRHETLQAALDWSYEMLEPAVRAVFEHLGVFVGRFELPAAASVASESNDEALIITAIDDLVSASLLTVAGADTASAQYRLLETVRQYALGRLGAGAGLRGARQRHSSYYLTRLAEARPALGTPDFAVWLGRFDDAYEEIRQALDWSLRHDPGAVPAGCAPTLFEYWYRQAKPEEAGRWGLLMLEGAPDAAPELRAASHAAVAFSAVIAGDLAGSMEHCDEAVRLCRTADDEEWLDTALFTKAQAAFMVGDFATMHSCGTEGLEICDRGGRQWSRARPLTVLGFAEWMGNGDLDRAAALFGEALPLLRELGDGTSQVVMALTPLCSISVSRGEVEQAERYALEAVALGGHWDGSALSSLGDALGAKGDLAGAESAYRRGLVRSMDTGLENWFRVNVRKLATLAVVQGEDERAARLWGASTPHIPDWGAGIGQQERAEVRARLGEERFEALAAEGSCWGHDAILLQVSNPSSG